MVAEAKHLKDRVKCVPSKPPSECLNEWRSTKAVNPVHLGVTLDRILSYKEQPSKTAAKLRAGTTFSQNLPLIVEC